MHENTPSFEYKQNIAASLVTAKLGTGEIAKQLSSTAKGSEHFGTHLNK